MNIQEQLELEHSKDNTVLITNYVIANPEQLSVVMDLFFNGDNRTSQRVSWVVSHVHDRNQQFLKPYLPAIIENLKNNEQHISIIRNSWRILQDMNIPEELEGLTLDLGFDHLLSSDSPIAVKVFAMTVLSNLVAKYPELAEELKVTIEDQIPYGSAGFKSRGKRILKKLNSIRE